MRRAAGGRVHQRSCRVRHHDLAAVGGRAEPGTSDDRRPEVVALIAQLDLAGVDGHANAHTDICRRPLGDERSGQPRSDAVGNADPSRSSPSPCSTGTVAAVRSDRLVEDLVVARHPRRWSRVPSRSHARVDPSMSVNESVTVPDGSPCDTAIPRSLPHRPMGSASLPCRRPHPIRAGNQCRWRPGWSAGGVERVRFGRSQCITLVPGVGFEPTRPFGQGGLRLHNPVRLIPPTSVWPAHVCGRCPPLSGLIRPDPAGIAESCAGIVQPVGSLGDLAPEQNSELQVVNS